MHATSSSGTEPPKKPWQIFDWPSEQQRIIQRSWGQYFSRMQLYSAAHHYINSCIDAHTKQSFRSLCLRSAFNRSVARGEWALEDIQRAAQLPDASVAELNLELTDVMYTLNRFEDNKMMLHDNLRKHVGSSMLPFTRRFQVVNENFKDSLGDSLTPFLLRCMPGKLRNRRAKAAAKTQPRWKLLKQLNECDVQSLLDKEETRLSPLDSARQQRKKQIFYRNYLNRAATDIFFLKSLRKHPSVVLEQCRLSQEKRTAELHGVYERVKTFTRMLHARSPMYSELYRRQGNKRMHERFKQSNLYRVQYQTRRNMLSILRTIRIMRERDETPRLRNFVAEIMCDYVVLKTNRIMPWKVEFINEVLNHLGLSLSEHYRLPAAKVTPYDKNALCTLLNVPVAKPTDYPDFVFGNRATYASGEAAKPELRAHRRLVAQLEARLFFSRLAIERAYLLHELAECHLLHNHFVQCQSYAKKAVAEAQSCNSIIWGFLSTMLLAKSHALLHKYERQTEVLNAAYLLAQQLKSAQLCTFVELCRMLNKDYITLRKMTQLESHRRLKQKLSNRGSSASPSGRSLMRSEHPQSEETL